MKSCLRSFTYTLEVPKAAASGKRDAHTHTHRERERERVEKVLIHNKLWFYIYTYTYTFILYRTHGTVLLYVSYDFTKKKKAFAFLL